MLIDGRMEPALLSLIKTESIRPSLATTSSSFNFPSHHTTTPPIKSSLAAHLRLRPRFQRTH
ncbi:hypothetical protein BDD12DRAFT_871525 [Trichophaea hybrida]|nr:hypothetical protein BDD12DRAFT_871525 [Trichophaea hybrida]